MFTVQIRDFEHWRTTARELLQRDTCPSLIQWEVEHQQGLFGDMAESHFAADVVYQQVYVSAQFLSLIEQAACYRDDAKWSVFYRLAYRIAFQEKELLNDMTDPDVARLYTMCKRVSRDKHKMKAFVRFKKMGDGSRHGENHLSDDAAVSIGNQCVAEHLVPEGLAPESLAPEDLIIEQYVAWFEPTHLIVESLATFFTQRFSNMHFAILTPDCCMYWNTKEVCFGEGVQKPDKVHDKLEELWCEYYANIFNPARVKLKAM